MLTRLFAAVVLLSAMTVFAQSQPQQSSNAIASQAITGNNSAADEFRISPYPQVNFDQPNTPTDDPIKAQSISRKQLIKLLDEERNRPRVVPGTQVQADEACLFIRSYRVVRDDPHSDATHFDGYTSCVPAARFRFYSAVDQSPLLPSQP